MSPLAYGLVFGGGCFAAAILISVACFRAWCREMAAPDEFAAQKPAGMGVLDVDPAVWAPTNRETWEPTRYHDTPIHDELAAEAVIASAAAVVAEAWRRDESS